jgi:uncharacterized protein with HEPN domain
MISAAMLTLIEEAGEGVLVLVDDLDEASLLRSRLTRAEVRKQLLTMADTLSNLPDEARAKMPEIDWGLWQTTATRLRGGREEQDEVLWFAVRSLVPATLSWMRVYRRGSPELFSFTV